MLCGHSLRKEFKDDQVLISAEELAAHGFFLSDKRQPVKIPVYVSEIGFYISIVCSIAIASD